ncbi:MAG: MBL fold metallo-hydrolase, partial [Candidatus Methanomethylophilaceae archaeon]|nr:MBL fold metallo-hydrolase [Candidatus Methanomethylophilaceae archaeon]
MEILFLGTGASVPSKDRSTSCIALRHGPDILLLDCGEGSQRQLMISPFSFMKVRAILVTHLHGDHVLG